MPFEVMKTPLLKKRFVLAMTGFSSAKLYRDIKNGLFPRPIKLGVGNRAGVAWLSSEVEAWIESRVRERDAANSTKAAGNAGSRESYLPGKPPQANT